MREMYVHERLHIPTHERAFYKLSLTWSVGIHGWLGRLISGRERMDLPSVDGVRVHVPTPTCGAGAMNVIEPSIAFTTSVAK